MYDLFILLFSLSPHSCLPLYLPHPLLSFLGLSLSSSPSAVSPSLPLYPPPPHSLSLCVHSQYLSTPESLLMIPELVRFICCVIHPPNEILQSDIVPRWALVGWLLSLCQVYTCMYMTPSLTYVHVHALHKTAKAQTKTALLLRS